jgi:hypothetical protein
MDKLREVGTQKGIVDPEVTVVPYPENRVIKSVQLAESNAIGVQRAIFALKVGKGSKHKVLIAGGIHAREWLSVEVPFLIAKYLIENYSETPFADNSEGLATSLEERKRIKHLLENREIWFVPMINPNGHMVTMTADRLWRSNYHPHGLPVRNILAIQHGTGEARAFTHPAGTYWGVDLNRNFPTRDWGEETYGDGTIQTSRNPFDGFRNIWAGPRAASEPETQAMVKLIDENRFKASISYHTFGKFLVYSNSAASASYLQHVGQGMRQVMKAPGATAGGYVYVCGDTTMYPITGHLADYCLERVPGQPAFTCELPPKDPPKDSPIDLHHLYNGLPDSAIEPAFREALPGALALINSAGFSQPAGRLKICADGSTRVVQVVRNCWQVFRDWQG